MLKKAIVLAFIFTSGIFMYVNMTEAQVVKDGLISYWTFDEAAKDFFGINNGSIKGAPETVVGKIGKALLFDGSDDYVDCGDDESLAFERTDEFSIQAWINNEGPDHEVIVAKMPSSGTYRGWMFWFRKEGTVGVVIRNDWPSRNLIEVNTTEIFPDSEWHHVVMTYDGSSEAAGVKVYVNGAVTTPNVVHDGLSETTIIDLNVNIGARDDGKNLFVGTIDEVGIYNRVLSEDEITQNFEATDSGLAVSPAGKLAVAWGKIKL